MLKDVSYIVTAAIDSELSVFIFAVIGIVIIVWHRPKNYKHAFGNT